MPDDKTNKIIYELLEEFKDKYPDFRGIYLFGLRARGDYHEDSDYDLAIFFNKDIDRKLKSSLTDIIFDKMIEYDVIIDNPMFNYKNILEPNMPLIDNIIKEGIFYEWGK